MHIDKSSFTLRIKPYNMESQEVDVFQNTSYVQPDALRYPSYRIQVLQYAPNGSCRYSDPLQYIPRTYESRQNTCILVIILSDHVLSFVVKVTIVHCSASTLPCLHCLIYFLFLFIHYHFTKSVDSIL